MNDNEKLIEEARAGLAAFDEYWGDGGPVEAAYGRPWELIRRLLAVFDKAHTPTDDERTRIEQSNAVADIVFDQVKRVWPELHPVLDLRYGIADALWVAGFRCSEVPEPSAEEWRAGEQSVADAMHYIANPEPSAEQVALCDQCGEVFSEHSCRPIPSCIHLPAPVVHDESCEADWGPEGQENPCRCGDQSQGEPSDAQVLAALDAFYQGESSSLSEFGAMSVKGMRAALRAAGVGGAR